jgi:fatty-acid desaturase
MIWAVRFQAHQHQSYCFMKKLFRKIRVTNSVFLIGTFATTCTAVPYYLWNYGLDFFQIALFLFFAISTAMSITLGYHRLFSHLTFQASPIVRLYTLLFGAAAFEGSALGWCADHRRHHKILGRSSRRIESSSWSIGHSPRSSGGPPCSTGGSPQSV